MLLGVAGFVEDLLPDAQSVVWSGLVLIGSSKSVTVDPSKRLL